MAELSQTAANVLHSSGGEIVDGTFGATIVAGNFLYFDRSANKWKLGQNDGTAAEAEVQGIALSGGSDGQPGKVLKPGTLTNPAIINLGATLSIGKPYFVGATAGSAMPADDVGMGVYSTYLGTATTAALFIFQPVASGVQTAAAIS